MDWLPASPSYVTWLLGQSVAVVVLVAWVVSLHRSSRRQSDENRALVTRNAELCDSLVELVQSHSQERAATRDTTLREVLRSLESALLSKPRE
jgi:hypothetical protein